MFDLNNPTFDKRWGLFFGDTGLVYENFACYRLWQDVVENSLTLGLILKHITALIEVLNLSAIKGYLVFRFATGYDKGSVKL